MLHISVVYSVHVIGSNFYHRNKNVSSIFDMGEYLLPDLHQNVLLQRIADFIAYIMPLLFGMEIAIEQAEYMIIVYIIRYVFNVSTILPKQTSCDDSRFGLSEVIFGHCYDKIYSGHFAALTIFTLIMYSRGYINAFVMVSSWVIYGCLIVSVRYHYTVDILVALIVSLLVFNNGWRISLWKQK